VGIYAFLYEFYLGCARRIIWILINTGFTLSVTLLSFVRKEAIPREFKETDSGAFSTSVMKVS